MAAAGSAHPEGSMSRSARTCLRPHTSHRNTGTMKKPCEKVLELLHADTIEALVAQTPTATAASTAATLAKARSGLPMRPSATIAMVADYIPLGEALPVRPAASATSSRMVASDG